MPQTVSMKLLISGSQTNPLDLGTAELPFSLSKAIALAAGVGADQSDLLFTDTRTLAASASESLDLVGVLASAFGSTINMARLKGIFILAADANTNDVQLTRPASNGAPIFLAAGDGVAIGPGDFFAITRRGATGFVLTAGTGDLVTLTNSAGGSSVTYSIVAVGASA